MMRRLLLLLLPVSGFAGWPAQAGDAAFEVRAMTYNIKQQNPRNPELTDSPHRWELRKNLVAGVIRDSSPDVLGIQEAYHHQLVDLLALRPEFSSVGNGRDGGADGEHCAILYRSERYRVDVSGTFWLSDTPERKSRTWGHFYHRICTWARLVEKSSGRAFYVFNTHLDHSSQLAREKSVRLIAARIHERAHPDPVLLTGDFNVSEDDPVVEYLLGKSPDPTPQPLVDSFRQLHPDERKVGTGNRFEGATDGPKVDYIFVTPDAKPIESSIVRSRREGRDASDHDPVTARLRLSAAGPTSPLNQGSAGR